MSAPLSARPTCPQPPKVAMPSTVRDGRQFTRGDWAIEKVFDFIQELEAYVQDSLPPQAIYHPTPGPALKVDFQDTVPVSMHELDRLRRRAHAYDALLNCTKTAVELARNRDMARLDLLGELERGEAR